ncbi:thioredoxin : Probable thioredoxin OS=Cupriavidus pinatubonensis (strain JMP 134 / LMG 1197) GN=Reut_B4067 PE=4 SV=1: Thioredoxin [Gemmataceae bacterium]|nr:thioredoxin : Probable thioredoxin OS=Cupriavidus pinatubonensis (strain JMP 134 / LMG 1197) GN=Reut_B4067 PE=4 SV=1: Thioredoxin [Gemmataceae bacterium]VTU01945.1 thioredoxin : Probable thioredoxin OS=Cupriavidus pinatubonensis (strain JMP 134 / LMG 1197) GN=Reut_B4067 PE=4 SV=1: Thioredoxin [Gemmataceae bacterium]
MTGAALYWVSPFPTEDSDVKRYEDPGPTRDEVDAWPGPAVLEFGADWCGHCQGAQPAIAAALEAAPGVRHVKVADGKGKSLGRSFTVKLWPTLIFLRDGKEVARAVRPGDEAEVRRGLDAVTGGA